MPPSSPIRSIAILFHERHRDAASAHYRIWALAELWRRRGIEVEPIYGIRGRSTPRADLLVPHLDLSYIPDDYWAFIQDHPNVVNRNVRDIRKTVYSTLRVAPGDRVDGPIIVKTVGNCGGFADEWLGRPMTLARRIRRRVLRSDWVETRCLGRTRSLYRYRVYDSLDRVPPAVFRNKFLLVERFIPEQRGGPPGDGARGGYVARLHTFFGSRSVGRIVASDSPIVKAGNGQLADPIEAPPEILQWQDRLGLNFGKMDYVIHDGKAVLIDVNVTPTMSDPPLDPAALQRTEPLADGLAYFQERPR